MKVVLFCGGAGMRLRGYADDVPKPMVQIGTRPILWHLMKYYAHFGHKDFISASGYKGNCHQGLLPALRRIGLQRFCLVAGRQEDPVSESRHRRLDDHFRRDRGQRQHRRAAESGGAHLEGEEMFLANYGDGLSDLPLPAMLETFRQSNAIASLLLVQPTASFDIVNTEPDGLVSEHLRVEPHPTSGSTAASS